MESEKYIFEEVEKLYLEFSKTVKPLIATVEAEREEFPIGILNEVRAFNDHIARCFAEKNDKDYVNQQLDKARNHITRICLDCYKILIFTYKDRIDHFNKINKKVDLGMVSDGIFFQSLTRLSRDSIGKVW